VSNSTRPLAELYFSGACVIFVRWSHHRGLWFLALCFYVLDIQFSLWACGCSCGGDCITMNMCAFLLLTVYLDRPRCIVPLHIHWCLLSSGNQCYCSWVKKRWVTLFSHQFCCHPKMTFEKLPFYELTDAELCWLLNDNAVDNINSNSDFSEFIKAI